MTHHHELELDLDGQLACISCGARLESGYPLSERLNRRGDQ
jgi:hypothetical protein